MLQLHYYHERFVLLVDENSDEFQDRAVQSKTERNNRELRGQGHSVDGSAGQKAWFHSLWIKEMFKKNSYYYCL